jgi:Glyoxalase-like domain
MIFCGLVLALGHISGVHKQFIGPDMVLGETLALEVPAESMKTMSSDLLARVDHLVYATPDLNRGIDELERLTGIRATPGGQHPGVGTRNALMSLGPSTYLEIIGPDRDQPQPVSPRSFGIDGLEESRLVTWAANSKDLECLRSDAERKGVALGPITPGSRKRPDGILLSWRSMRPTTAVADGIVPFFIDWGQAPHPSQSAARGLSLIELRAEHPDSKKIEQMLKALELDLRVNSGSRPALIAVINGPRGKVELR